MVFKPAGSSQEGFNSYTTQTSKLNILVTFMTNKNTIFNLHRKFKKIYIYIYYSSKFDVLTYLKLKKSNQTEDNRQSFI